MNLKCDNCGQFVSIHDLETDKALHELIFPDSAYTREKFSTLCKKCKPDVLAQKNVLISTT